MSKNIFKNIFLLVHPFALDLWSFSSLRPFGGGSNFVVRPPYMNWDTMRSIKSLVELRSEAESIKSLISSWSMAIHMPASLVRSCHVCVHSCILGIWYSTMPICINNTFSNCLDWSVVLHISRNVKISTWN